MTSSIFDAMDPPNETASLSTGRLRRDTVSTISSDKLPSMPSGKWSLTIHGNCARCRHYHKAALVQMNVVEGFLEPSHVVCERCNQKWLTIGGSNATQLSLLSTVTTDLDPGEMNFRYTLFSMIRSAASIAAPTALANVPEDPSPAPSRSSSGPAARGTANSSDTTESRNTMDHNFNPAPMSSIATNPKPIPDHTVTGPHTSSKQPQAGISRLSSFRRKFKETVGILKKAHFRRFVFQNKEPRKVPEDGSPSRAMDLTDSQQPPVLPGDVVSGSPDDVQPKEGTNRVHNKLEKTFEHAITELKSFDKEIIRKMDPEQRQRWIREQITAVKCCCTCQRISKRRHSSSSISNPGSLREYLFPTTTFSQRISLDQMGSQFDALPGALFTHTGPLTISATRISEADTAVEHQTASSTPRHSRVDFAQQVHRSRSPRHSWQHLRNDRTQRNSIDSVLAGSTFRNSWRGTAHSTTSLVPQSTSPGSITPRTTDADL